VKARAVARVLGFTATLLVTATRAEAQTDEQRAGARAAAEAGADAFDAGKYAEAADLFARAERMVHAPPHLLYGARAHAKLGQLVQARELYLKLTRERLPETAPKVFRDAQQSADSELAEVEARLPYVSVVVQGTNAKNVRVNRDGTPISPDLVGVPHPVDPGEHEFQAFADGMESASTRVQLKESARETVVLTLNAVAPAPGATDAGGAAGNGTPQDTGVQVSTQGSGLSPMKIGAFVGFGVGALGIGIGTFFVIKSSSTDADADEAYQACLRVSASPRCTDPELSAETQELDDDAASQRNIAIASYVVGGLGIGAGITLLLLDSGRSGSARGPGVEPVIGLNYYGLRGRF
jgi:hypothetical protein